MRRSNLSFVLITVLAIYYWEYVKYILIAITIIILSLATTFTSAFAADASSEDIADVMQSLGIMNGYTDGNLHLNDKLTRAQFAKIVINET